MRESITLVLYTDAANSVLCLLTVNSLWIINIQMHLSSVQTPHRGECKLAVEKFRQGLACRSTAMTHSVPDAQTSTILKQDRTIKPDPFRNHYKGFTCLK